MPSRLAISPRGFFSYGIKVLYLMQLNTSQNITYSGRKMMNRSLSMQRLFLALDTYNCSLSGPCLNCYFSFSFVEATATFV